MIPREIIEDIRQRADIVETIASYIPVVKKGNNYMAVCPFHADKNPSLTISKSKQIFKCFACNHSGNVFGFVADYEHVTFVEAVKKVATFINYDDASLHEKVIENKNYKLLNALNDTCEFYHLLTKSNGGVAAKDYFQKRNIDETMQDYFKLGFSPSDSTLTLKMLASKGHDVMTLDKAGITTRDKGEIIDRFNNRVIFPIFDINGSCIGFSGRIIDNSSDSKYVNSPTNEIFNKSSVLYNINNARIEAKGAGYCYIVEGFMDVFALYKVGIKSSVAIMGTAFTKYHAKILRKLGVELRLMLDGDAAGRKAIEAMMNILDSEKIAYKVVDYKDNLLDPDETLNQLGKDALIKLSNNLVSGNDYLIDYYLKQHDITSIDGKMAFLASLAPRCYMFETKLEREEYAKILAKLTNTKLSSVAEIARKYRHKEDITNEDINNVKVSFAKRIKRNRLENLERELIYQMLHDENAIKDFLNSPNVSFADDIYGLIYNYVLDFYEKNKSISVSRLCDELVMNNSPKNILNEITSISLEENHIAYNQESVLDAINLLVVEINKMEIARKKEKINEINDETKKAELLKELSLKAKNIERK